MRTFILNMLLLVSVAAFTQDKRVTGLPGLGNPDVKTTDGKIVNANAIKDHQAFILSLPVYNLDLVRPVAKMAYTININLGDKVSIDDQFNLSAAPLSDYFAWTLGKTSKGELLITGTLKQDLPARFRQDAVFQLKSQAGNSTITALWVKPNKAATDKDPQTSSINIKTQ